MKRSYKHEFTITGPLILSDLRWLIDQTGAFPDDVEVRVTARIEYDIREMTPETITVIAHPVVDDVQP